MLFQHIYKTDQSPTRLARSTCCCPSRSSILNLQNRGGGGSGWSDPLECVGLWDQLASPSYLKIFKSKGSNFKLRTTDTGTNSFEIFKKSWTRSSSIVWFITWFAEEEWSSQDLFIISIPSRSSLLNSQNRWVGFLGWNDRFEGVVFRDQVASSSYLDKLILYFLFFANTTVPVPLNWHPLTLENKLTRI